jgi:hypothetical protein
MRSLAYSAGLPPSSGYPMPTMIASGIALS